MGLSEINAEKIQTSIINKFLMASSKKDINGVSRGLADKTPADGYNVTVMFSKKASEERKQEIRDCAAEILERQPTNKELKFAVTGSIKLN